MMDMEIPTSNEWHILKGETQFGPYTYQDMLHMKQNNMLFDFDYVWSPHLEVWTLTADLAEFSPDRVSRLMDKNANAEAFKRRDSLRVPCDFEVIVHDDIRMWKGRLQNISMGGGLILIENPLLLPGDLVTLHVRQSGPLQSGFNCTTQVLNKRLVRTRIQHDTAIHYAVKFLNLTEIGKTEVHRLLEGNPAELLTNQKSS